ncbi:MAG: protoheme IX farnesyltransferase [Chloroflexi bacterium]|nr:protoheme IX farnesyltransferase [Chloroflexota bacterium]
MTPAEQNTMPEVVETADLPEEETSSHPWLAVINDYVTLTKPPIILLLLVTAAGGMFLAQAHSGQGGAPSLLLMVLVWIGGALASGGANALNHHYDRDIDGVMQRTRRRPVASNRISPVKALAFGVTLNVIAFAVLALWVNLLAAGLTLAATLFYVLVYTRWLKRTTPHNIVIGGAAGSIPPMVGWAAVTGTVELPAVYLFAIIFFWTPPHFWALALLIQKDYERASVPMLPVVASRNFTVSTIFLYSLVLVGVTLMFALTDAVSWVYTVTAVVLGAIFTWMAWRLRQDESAVNAKKLYLFSLLYLGLLYVAVMVGAATGY